MPNIYFFYYQLALQIVLYEPELLLVELLPVDFALLGLNTHAPDPEILWLSRGTFMSECEW